MALTKTDIERIVLRAERTARREMDLYERRQPAAVEDPERNRQMMLKKRMKWRSKFNVLGLLFTGSLVSLSALFTVGGN